MKFDPIPRKNIFGEGCFIKSPENLLYFTEEFDLAGVNWGAPAGISAPYFLASFAGRKECQGANE